MADTKAKAKAKESPEKEAKRVWFETIHAPGATNLAPVPPGGVDVEDEDGRTALHWAATENRTEQLKALLSLGASAKHRDDGGWTPLMSASSAGHVAAVRELLGSKGGIDVNDTNARGCSALHYAASKGRADVVLLLAESGADIRKRDGMGSTAMHRAASCADGCGVIEALLGIATKAGKRAQSLLEDTNNEGEVPLHVAVAMRNVAVATLLIKLGPTALDHKDKGDKTPMDYATKAFRESMAPVLSQLP